MNEPTPSRPPFAEGYTAGPDDPFRPSEWAAVTAALGAAHNYWVCTTRPDGRPHASPVWALWLAGAVWFSTGPNSVKARNLEANPHAVIHLESGDEAIILEGTVELVTADNPAHRHTCEQWVLDYKDKYDIVVDLTEPDFALFRLAPKKIMTWSEPDFPNSNARWVFG